MPGDQRRGCHQRDEAGFITAEWMAGIAMLVLPVLVIGMTVPAWASRHEAAAAAAREGARVAATAATFAEAATLAHQAVADSLDGRGVPREGVRVEVAADQTAGSVLARQGRVSVTVTLPSVTVALPFVGTLDGPAASGSYTRTLDPFRTR